MNRRFFLANVAAAAAFAQPLRALAQHEHGDHADHEASPATANAHVSNAPGQVTRVDARASKITIKHGPIKEFGFDEGHTMVFRAQSPALLNSVKAGDKVKFDAERVNGEYILSRIQKTT